MQAAGLFAERREQWTDGANAFALAPGQILLYDRNVKTAEELSRMKQGAKNLTLQRANAVRDALLAYAKQKGVTLDANQFATVGNGFMKPNVSGCVFDKDGDITAKCAPRTKDEWDAMRRVVFSVVSVEAESASFQALK